MTDLKLGIYQHFKGNYYLVLGRALHSETEEALVVYVSLYPNKKSALWVRPAKMFLEEITRDGKTFPRFKFIGTKTP